MRSKKEPIPCSRQQRIALADFYTNMEEWALSLDDDGYELFLLWADSGTFPPGLFRYFPRPVREYFNRVLAVTGLQGVENGSDVPRKGLGVIRFAT